jgi:predicted esterase
MKPMAHFLSAISLFILLLSSCNSSPPSHRSLIQLTEIDQNLDLSGISPDQPVFVEVSAQPSLGFQFEYYLFIPPGARHPESDTRLLVRPNNTGTGSDDHSVHARSAQRTVAGDYVRQIAESLNAPLLVPVFDRPETGRQRYTHALDSDTMGIDQGKLQRIDLQLTAMINHAKGLLEAAEIPVEERVFMDGFSASGNFTNRFVALHPGLVRAAVMGGVNGMPILPVASLKGRELPFHVGVADMEQYTGKPFDLETYRTVAQYLFMGELDDNDTLPYDDAYNDDERELTAAVLGESMAERWRNSQTIYNSLNLSVRFATYAGVGHHTTDEMVADIIRFFQANRGNAIELPAPMGKTVPNMRS